MNWRPAKKALGDTSPASSPYCPENAPDPWEEKGLKAFEAGAEEIMEVVSVAGMPQVRYMRSWRAEKSCLKCHAAQGYKEGDIQGGISVSVPLEPYLAGVKAQVLPLALTHGLIWMLGLTAIWLRERHLRRDLKQRRQAEDSLRNSRSQLQTIFDNLTEGVLVSTIEGRFLTWNRAALQMHGYASLEECCDRLSELPDTFELATMDGVVLPLEQWPLSLILRGERLSDLELRVRRLDKEWERIYNFGGELVRDQAGTPLLAIVSVADITERKKAAEALAPGPRHPGGNGPGAHGGTHAVVGRAAADIRRLPHRGR